VELFFCAGRQDDDVIVIAMLVCIVVVIVTEAESLFFAKSCRLLLTVCNCHRFSADRLWICVIFGHEKVMESQCQKRGHPRYSGYHYFLTELTANKVYVLIAAI